mgnify:FL=1
MVADLLEPEMEPHAQLQANFKQWQLRREAESFAVKQAKESLRRSGDEAASSSSELPCLNPNPNPNPNQGTQAHPPSALLPSPPLIKSHCAPLTV